jgi:hypothetical protein
MTLFAKVGPDFTISPAPTAAGLNTSTGFGTIGPSDPFPGGLVQK